MKPILYSVLVVLFISCKKDYADKPSPYQIGQQVKLNGIDPSKSFVPHGGGVAPLTVVAAYTKGDYYWYYNTIDSKGDSLVHVDNEQLKPYK